MTEAARVGASLLVGALAAWGVREVVGGFAQDGPWRPGRCPHCGAGLGAADTLPFVHPSGVLCKACGAPVPASAWLDLLTLLGTVLIVSWAPAWALARDLLVLWLGLAAGAIDVGRRVIPNRLLLAGLALGLLALWPIGLAAYVQGAVGAALLLALGIVVAWVGRGGFGMGDVKYLALAGGLLGWQRGLAALFIAVLGGGLYAAWLLLTRRASGKDAFAFGPFIALGTVLALALGAR